MQRPSPPVLSHNWVLGILRSPAERVVGVSYVPKQRRTFFFVTQSVRYRSVLHVGIVGCVVVKLAALNEVSLQCFYLPDSLTLFLLFSFPLPVYSA